jgi:hypothetical protein
MLENGTRVASVNHTLLWLLEQVGEQYAVAAVAPVAPVAAPQATKGGKTPAVDASQAPDGALPGMEQLVKS